MICHNRTENHCVFSLWIQTMYFLWYFPLCFHLCFPLFYPFAFSFVFAFGKLQRKPKLFCFSSFEILDFETWKHGFQVSKSWISKLEIHNNFGFQDFETWKHGFRSLRILKHGKYDIQLFCARVPQYRVRVFFYRFSFSMQKSTHPKPAPRFFYRFFLVETVLLLLLFIQEKTR